MRVQNAKIYTRFRHIFYILFNERNKLCTAFGNIWLNGARTTLVHDERESDYTFKAKK